MQLRLASLSCASLALLLSACGDDGSGATTAGTDATVTPETGSSGVVAPTTGSPPTTGEPTTGTTGTSGSASDGTSGGVSATSTGGTTADPSVGTTTTGATTTGGDTTTTGGGTTTGSSSDTGAACPEGTIVCDGDTSQTCDGVGGFKDVVACENVCIDGVGCKLCVPGVGECMGDKALKCNDQGDGKDEVETCDAVQGVVCDADQGACAGACSAASLGLSYIGCDYYPTVLQQHDSYNGGGHIYSVAVANTSNKVTKVTITRGANVVVMQMVAANSVQLITLPWVNELTKGQGPSAVVVDGAYRLRSDNPVTVYQYNPLAATTTNDASVLLPTNTWTGNYLVAAWPTWINTYPGFYAVVARQDGTKVTLLPSATGKSIKAGGGVAADGTGVVMLNEGDVLQVMSAANDVTGTIVQADKPVQVFGGHECTNVPLNVAACDHLEESMFPIETLAKEYLIAPMAQTPNENLDKGQVIRVIASEDATTLVFSPDQPVNKFLAKAGDFVEIPSTAAKFLITADKKILVSQYMVGQLGGYGDGDPAMLLAVNPLQWRKTYLVHAPTSWVANYLDLMAKTGAAVLVDGNAVAGWQPIGQTGYSHAHVKLSNAGNGNHSVTADQGVGVAVYGVQSSGSYWYPGGLDLDVIPQ